MPRTPPNASKSAASVTALASCGRGVRGPWSVGLSSDVTGYSCPSGRSSYFGLNSTRRPWLMEIRPEAISLRPGSMPDDGAPAEPHHVQRGGAVEQLRLQRGHSGARPQRDRAQGTSDLHYLPVVAVADPGAARGLARPAAAPRTAGPPGGGQPVEHAPEPARRLLGTRNSTHSPKRTGGRVRRSRARTPCTLTSRPAARPRPADAAPHCSKRYPIPGSVMKCRGCEGSLSSLRRSWAM